MTEFPSEGLFFLFVYLLFCISTLSPEFSSSSSLPLLFPFSLHCSLPLEFKNSLSLHSTSELWFSLLRATLESFNVNEPNRVIYCAIGNPIVLREVEKICEGNDKKPAEILKVSFLKRRDVGNNLVCDRVFREVSVEKILREKIRSRMKF
jgi:hypothetical protein